MTEYNSRVERKKAEKALKKAEKEAAKNIKKQKMNTKRKMKDVHISSDSENIPVSELPIEAAVEISDISAGDKMIQGTFWMTFGSIFSRLLGALYIIPWNAMMGSSSDIGNALFAVGYPPYQLFLALGIAGFPSAMSKKIAQYNAKKQYRAGEELFKKSMVFMLITGVISSIIMYAIAPIIASNSPGSSVEDNTLVIRALAPALLVVPAMSLVRGYFQGYQNMIPSAITQVVEQVVRVVYILFATFLVMQVFNGRIAVAVAHSTFAAFIGAVASCMMLVWYYRKHMQKFAPVIESSPDDVEIDIKSAIKEMLKESIPFILIGSGITFGKLIDQFSFSRFMAVTTEYNTVTIAKLYGLFSFNADKLIMIIISLAVGLSATAIPLLVENYTQKNINGLREQIKKIFELFAFVMFPSALGMMVVSKPIYNLFYGVSDYNIQGVQLLAIASIMSIILGAFTISATILQSFGKHIQAILYLGIGLLAKMILQYPMIALFETAGPLYSTSIGFLLTTVLCMWNIHKIVSFDLRSIGKSVLIISLITGWMTSVAFIARLLLEVFLSPDRRLTALLLVAGIAVAGGSVFMYLALKTRIADQVLGNRIGSLRQKFHIK
ncbi:polysaccharide biosynthesis protein [Jeotgalibaca sp. MA1X17-3]|uniref:putative polysaccharide biosynthesis protein n=1 Tax=Jeotgalibaca sp. MA1X17-3 TaxID=2908211 RepID=UPI001F3BC63D|nr:polysaccharide biosynthesis protein [Jeotgalibaca sp. MA1X17-3]UJF14634.1 polysaccharide biosynthesis protein [Jeotgalibaca sp. MA1X17-3]